MYADAEAAAGDQQDAQPAGGASSGKYFASSFIDDGLKLESHR